MIGPGTTVVTSPSTNPPAPSARPLDEQLALRLLFEGTARETGEAYFQALVQNLAKALGTIGAWVTEYDPERRRLRALAFWLDGKFIAWEQDIEGTMCGEVIDHARLVLVPNRAFELFPGQPDPFGAVSYMGVPLEETDGTIIGHLAVLDTRPMPEEPRLLTVFQLFAQRAAAELQRLRAEQRVREREEKLAGVVDGAMDARIELDESLRVTHVNAAAERIFGSTGGKLVGTDFSRLLAAEEGPRLRAFVDKLDAGAATPGSAWIPGGLRARTADGAEFPAEATIARHRRRDKLFHTLVLRDVNDRVRAEETIRALTAQTSVLQEQVRALGNFGDILGRSEALRRVLQDVEQVADTDASVLLLGETGTGKELVARAIHARSARRDKPLVAVNCAAIPKDLVESELFGHEKGAFTGATARRDGRFALADGGTIFLDELGELPTEIQVKLLRACGNGSGWTGFARSEGGFRPT